MRRAVAFAEANVVAGFELAQRLLEAKDPQEMGAVYQSHLKEQMEKMNAQFRELGNHDEQAGTRRSEQVAHCGESIGSAVFGILNAVCVRP